MLLQPEVVIRPGAVGGPGAAVLTASVPPGRPKVGAPQIEYWSWVYIGPLSLSLVIHEITPQSDGRPSRRNSAQSCLLAGSA